jgi:hypothetical protein
MVDLPMGVEVGGPYNTYGLRHVVAAFSKKLVYLLLLQWRVILGFYRDDPSGLHVDGRSWQDVEILSMPYIWFARVDEVKRSRSAGDDRGGRRPVLAPQEWWLSARSADVRGVLDRGRFSAQLQPCIAELAPTGVWWPGLGRDWRHGASVGNS